MSFRDWLQGWFADKEPELDPLDLSLADLKKGYLVDYDLKTWQVTSHNTYDFDGERAEEWELFSGDDRCYLQGEKDDEYAWSISRKIAFSALGPDGQRPSAPARRSAPGDCVRRDPLHA